MAETTMGLTSSDQIALASVIMMIIVLGLSFLRRPTFMSAAKGSELLSTIAQLRSEVSDLRTQLERCQAQLNQARDENRYLERKLRALEDRPIRGPR